MIISSSDMQCRYIAAPGTDTGSGSPFGSRLKSLEIEIPGDCSLDYMVRAGWIDPVLRVSLPRAALEAWENFPEFLDNALPARDNLRGSLRQDIEHALYLLRILTGRPIDFLAPDWTYPDRFQRSWAQLIDALPRDIELARSRFSHFALPYLGGYVSAVRGQLPVDAKAIDDLLASFWNESRALRRFCLAFFRMHEELKGSGCVSGKNVLHSNEAIEQLLLSILNAERLVVAMDRKKKAGGQRSTQDVAKDQLNLLLGKIKLGKNRIRMKVMNRFDEVYKERGRLDDLDTRGPRIFINSADIGSGSPDADFLTAAHVNFVIARNYAAHHDSLDEEIMAPDVLDPSLKLGWIATQSMLTVVLGCLQTVS